MKTFRNRRITLLVLALLISVCSMYGVVQRGYVKTPGRLDAKGRHIPGNGLKNVTIKLSSGGNGTTSGNRGYFELQLNGNTFTLKQVNINGFILVDPDLIGRSVSATSGEYVILMQKPETYYKELYEKQKQISADNDKRYKKQKQELNKLLKDKKILEKDYRQALQRLDSLRMKNELLVPQLAERYVKMDFDQMDDFKRELTFYMMNGELEKADSLLRRGESHESVIARRDELRNYVNNEKIAMEQKRLNITDAEADIARINDDEAFRCYARFEIYDRVNEVDSAAYWIMARANIDSLNYQWQFDAAEYLVDCGYDSEAEKIINRVNETVPERSAEAATALNYLGRIYGLNDQSKALQYHKLALEIQKGIFETDNHEIAKTYTYMGNAYFYSWDPFDYTSDSEFLTAEEKYYKHLGKALEYYQKAFDIDTKEMSSEDYIIAEDYDRLADTYRELGNDDLALYYYHLEESILKKLLDPDDLQISLLNTTLSSIYYINGDYENYLSYLMKELPIRENSHNQLEEYDFYDPLLPPIYMQIAGALQKLDRSEESLDYYRKALNIMEKHWEPFHSDIVLAYYNMAALYLGLEKYAVAIECFEKARKINEDYYPKALKNLARCNYFISLAYEKMGDTEKAKKYRPTDEVLEHLFDYNYEDEDDYDDEEYFDYYYENYYNREFSDE